MKKFIIIFLFLLFGCSANNHNENKKNTTGNKKNYLNNIKSMKTNLPTLHKENYSILEYSELKKKYSLNMKGNYDGEKVMVYEGNLEYDGDIFLLWEQDLPEGKEAFLDKQVAGIYVLGNVTLSGGIYNLDGGPFLQIDGRLTASNLVGGDGEIYINGGADVENIIYGFYNDGILVIDGDTRAKYIFSSDHHFSAGNVKSGIDFGDIFGGDYKKEFIKYATEKALDLDEMIFEGQEYNDFLSDIYLNDNIGLLISEGEAIFREVPRNNSELLSFYIRENKKRNLRIEELSFENIKNISFDKHIADLQELKSLYIWNDENKDISKSFIDNIGMLKNLKELNITLGNDEVFPESILSLKKLKKLTITSNKLKNIPKTLNNLDYLELNIYNNIILPKEFTYLRDIKKLLINNFTDEYRIENISAILQLKQLEYIEIGLKNSKDMPGKESFPNYQYYKINNF